jgi:hypothetical protein
LEESDVSVDLMLQKTFSIGQTLSLNHGDVSSVFVAGRYSIAEVKMQKIITTKHSERDDEHGTAVKPTWINNRLVQYH